MPDFARESSGTPTASPRADESLLELVSLVIPVMNERESLGPLHEEIAAMAAASGLPLEVIFVDDGSNDGSWEVIAKLAATDPRVIGLRFRRNFGKAAALAAGFQKARGNMVVTLDADLQDDPREVPRLIARLHEGSMSSAAGKKFGSTHGTRSGRAGSSNQLVGLVTGVWLHDHNCGMKGYRLRVCREVKLYGELHRCIPVLASSLGFKIGELVIQHRPRKYGRSKYGIRRLAKGLLDLFTVQLLTGFGHRPQHFLGSLAMVSGFVGVLLFLLVIANGIYHQFDPQAGLGAVGQIVASILGTGLLLLASQLFIAGLIGELIVHKLLDDRDSYRIDEIVPAGFCTTSSEVSGA